MIRLLGLAALCVLVPGAILFVLVRLVLRGRERRAAKPTDNLGAYFREQIARTPVSRVTETREPAEPLRRSFGFQCARADLAPPVLGWCDAPHCQGGEPRTALGSGRTYCTACARPWGEDRDPAPHMEPWEPPTSTVLDLGSTPDVTEVLASAAFTVRADGSVVVGDIYGRGMTVTTSASGVTVTYPGPDLTQPDPDLTGHDEPEALTPAEAVACLRDELARSHGEPSPCGVAHEHFGVCEYEHGHMGPHRSGPCVWRAA